MWLQQYEGAGGTPSLQDKVTLHCSTSMHTCRYVKICKGCTILLSVLHLNVLRLFFCATLKICTWSEQHNFYPNLMSQQFTVFLEPIPTLICHRLKFQAD